MRATRLYTDTELVQGATLELSGEAARHVARVLRLQVGAPLVLFDGRGAECDAVLTAVSPARAEAELVGAVRRHGAPLLAITLGQALARGDKMDWVVQKATELGASVIAPLLTARCEVRLDATRATRRLAHWRAITIAACEQSGRTWLPQITPIASLAEWAQAIAGSGQTGLALAPKASASLRSLALAEATGLALAIGPEGGFDEAELHLLDQAGFVRVRLGPRVLRTETAGLAAIAALQTLHGDF